MNAQDTINTIRADLRDYNDAEFKTLLGRLTLNAYGSEVSEALADEVITERKRRSAAAKLETDKLAAEEWLEANSHALTEDRPDQLLAFGAEYFDLESYTDDAEGLDYYEFMGLRAVSESTRTIYVDTGTLESTPRDPRDVGVNDGHVRYLKPLAPISDRVATEVLPYRGQPITKRYAACARSDTYQCHISDQKALAEMANKDRQKAQRYARKHMVTIGAAIGKLRADGKID